MYYIQVLDYEKADAMQFSVSIKTHMEYQRRYPEADINTIAEAIIADNGINPQNAAFMVTEKCLWLGCTEVNADKVATKDEEQ